MGSKLSRSPHIQQLVAQTRTLCNVALSTSAPKLQIRRPSTREPETPPLPSWLGSWVGFSEVSQASAARKETAAPGFGDIVARAVGSVGTGRGEAGEQAARILQKTQGELGSIGSG